MLQNISAVPSKVQSSPSDVTGELDLNPSLAIERLDSWLDGFVKLIPNIIAALIIFAIFIALAFLAKKLVMRSAKKRGRNNLGEILGGFIKAAIILGGALFAVTIIMPSLSPGDLVAGLGVSSVAIGFAFKDILQNWLAGLLLLIRQPFEIGDHIEVSGFSGVVKQIESRATIIKTFDGERIVIPNSEIYTNAVNVVTGYEKRRSHYDVGIGYADDIDKACEIIESELSKIDGIEQDPAPEAFAWDLAASWVTIRTRWWTDSTQGHVVRNKAKAIRAIKLALDKAGIDMPYETNVQLFHDQTEETDGRRGEQREGWPEPLDQDRPASRADVIREQSQ